MTVEYLPLTRNGVVNTELMSFSSLYLDEIVQRILGGFEDAPIYHFLETIDATEFEVSNTKDDVEWLVWELLRSKEGFMELHHFLSINRPSLLDRMMLRNESHLYKEVVDAFKQYFLIPACDLSKRRFQDVEDIGSDSDEENSEDSIEESSDAAPDSGDTSNDAVSDGYVDTVLDKIAAIFDPEFAHNSLVRSYDALKTVTDPLRTPKNAAKMNYTPWARAILRELPRMAPERDELPKFPSIVYKFARACESSPTNRVAILYLLPKYDRKLDERDAALRARHDKGGITLDKVGLTDVIKECRPPASYASQRKAQTQQYQNTVMPIRLREYQKELVEKANLGENTVIVAPTGSGKTVVAAQIMRYHVMRRRAEKKPYRMVMVVPKIPLVEQQQKQLYQYMEDVVYSAILHGDMMFEEQAKIEKVLCAELIVMTPQILINLLESMRAKERLFVSDMTLLILDECHHCCSNHPYAQLMAMVRQWEHDKPQIVGLTASLGVGKSTDQNESSAYEHVVSLLARMTATSISTVVIYEKELASHVQLPVDDVKPVEQPDGDTTYRPFTTQLEGFMNLINTGIRKDLKWMSNASNDSGALIPQSLVRSGVDYTQTEKYGGRIEAIKQAIRTMNDGTKKADILMALDILKVCNMTWGLNDLLPSSTVWPMMKMEMNSLRSRNKDNDFIQKFYSNFANKLDHFKETEDDTAMLRELRTVLAGQMRKNPRSKVIVFVGTREMAKALSDYISERKDLLGLGQRECGYIISSKARGLGTVSQSPPEQSTALAKFRDNKLAVLVSTTVAEEGLDVPECNLIIKYNMTGNVISLTQQRGRARAKDSRCVLIALSGSVKKRELENANAEKMMNHIVRKLYLEGAAKLKRAVEMKTVEMEKERQRILKEEMEKEGRLKLMNFFVICSDCNQVLCDSDRMKHGDSHYFVCDNDIWNRICIDYDGLNGKYIDHVTTVLGAVLCKGAGGTCKKNLGKVVRYHGCYFPSLKCASLQFKDEMQRAGRTAKNWSEVSESLFYISKIDDDDDVGVMMDALSQHNLELFELLELSCRALFSKTRRAALRKYELEKGGKRGDESD